VPWRVPRYAVLAAVLALNGWADVNLLMLKPDVWTVYKPKNDWRAAAQYFRSEMRDGSAPLLLFATAPASVLVYYDGRFAEVYGADTAGRPGARALIKYLGARDEYTIGERLRGQHADAGYLIEDTFWEHGFKELLATVQRDPALRVLGEQSFRGIHIFKVGLTHAG